MIRFLLIFWFLVSCLRHRAKPWNYFQLNAKYFNEAKGIFSKLDIDRLIPEQWRLPQFLEDGKTMPPNFPVFCKPEWGQNSHGIKRADTVAEFRRIRRQVAGRKNSYIVQEAAKESREFEVFYIRSSANIRQPALLSITEVLNRGDQPFPINGIYNRYTEYSEQTPDFSGQELDALWDLIKDIGLFRLARVGLRADSKSDLLAGRFHIIEINLFLPMPLSLLDRAMDWSQRHAFIRRAMGHLAATVGALPLVRPGPPVFLKKVLAHYRVKI